MKLWGITACAVLLALGLVVMVTGKSANMKSFVYDQATVEEQVAWLRRQARIYRRDIAGNLPTKWGYAPRMEVEDLQVDPAKRTIHFYIQAREEAQLVQNAAAVESKWLKIACRKFIHSSFYNNRVTIVDSFHLQSGERSFQASISPERCDEIYPVTEISAIGR